MARKKKLNICLATAEFAPLAKTGGLADVSAALSAYLHKAGHDVRVVMPFYSTLNRGDLKFDPVDNFQNLTVTIGPWDVEYSVYRTVLPTSGLSVNLLRCPALFDRAGLYTAGKDEHLRFLLLSRAAIELCQHMQFSPDIFHCHDWHAATIPLYLKSNYAWDKLFANTRSVLTIHNIGYQGKFPAEILADMTLGPNVGHLHQDDLSSGVINFLKTGILYADLLTTVSPTYAREIQGAEYGMGLDDVLRARSDSLIGILNGVDDEEWNPQTDTLIPRRFSMQNLAGKKTCKKELLKELGLDNNPARPLIGIVSRFVSQKGFDLMEAVLPRLLSQRDFSLAVLGSGDPHLEKFFDSLHRQIPDRVSFYRGFNNKLAHWIEAGADMFLMPSRYEPCGLNQMYSLKYGTVPIVRETGGLADSVQQVNPSKGTGTGILFRDYDTAGLAWAINTALDLYKDRPLWKEIMLNGMAMDFSWQQQGEQYVKIFRKLSGK
ncbi:MAG TPA: glycogen synthase GlgA [Woeseiaceae bacterium]|nr:glycogen synthase GlgA [Woeseiaceae bacterium]